VIGFYLGYYILDAIASILICGFILKVAIEIFNDAIDQMIDHACSREFQEDLISLITEQSEIINIDDLKT
ncbi:cation-efflux pump, partial [Anaerostipes caccae]|nr:cation-efflux pump [Anaerostipes caccae]